MAFCSSYCCYHVEQVLASAGHVALYDFDQQTNSWVCQAFWRICLRCFFWEGFRGYQELLQNRKDVEGTLFVIKRRTAPRFQYIILNKKSQGAHDRGSFSAVNWTVSTKITPGLQTTMWRTCLAVSTLRRWTRTSCIAMHGSRFPLRHLELLVFGSIDRDMIHLC